jgi:hypothetical protein
MNDASLIVGEMASLDLSMTLGSQDRIASMMNGVKEMNRQVARQLGDISVIAEEISSNVEVSVRSLQFEDMTRQLLDQVGQHVAAAKNSITMTASFLEKHPDLLSRNSKTIPGVARPEKTKKQEFAANTFTANQSVTQKSIVAGDISLF